MVLVPLLALSFWLFKAVTKPLPGVELSDLGKDHVTDIFGVKYNSNPPTSGSHFPIWAKPGIYDRLISDGYLIHSLEHGYVILSYDCSKLAISHKPYAISQVLAHDEPAKDSTDSGQFLMHMNFKSKENESWFTPENPPEIEVALPESFNSDSCKKLVNRLSEFTKTAQRVIVVPRLGMDTPIVLTAWGRLMGLNNVDQKSITNFIKIYHNKGPEATTE